MLKRLFRRGEWLAERREKALAALADQSELDWCLYTVDDYEADGLQTLLRRHLDYMTHCAAQDRRLAHADAALIRKAILSGVLEADIQSRSELESALGAAFPDGER